MRQLKLIVLNNPLLVLIATLYTEQFRMSVIDYFVEKLGKVCLWTEILAAWTDQNRRY